jgi:hypothetical protein
MLPLLPMSHDCCTRFQRDLADPYFWGLAFRSIRALSCRAVVAVCLYNVKILPIIRRWDVCTEKRHAISEESHITSVGPTGRVRRAKSISSCHLQLSTHEPWLRGVLSHSDGIASASDSDSKANSNLACSAGREGPNIL